MHLELLADEKIIFKSKAHPMMLWWVAIMGGFAIWFFWAILFTEFGLFLLGFGLIVLCYLSIVYFNTSYTVTNQRVVARAGSVTIETQIAWLNEVKDVRVSQDSFGRSFNFGSVVVSAGTVPLRMDYVRNANEFVRHLNEQVAQNRPV